MIPLVERDNSNPVLQDLSETYRDSNFSKKINEICRLLFLRRDHLYRDYVVLRRYFSLTSNTDTVLRSRLKNLYRKLIQMGENPKFLPPLPWTTD